MIVLQVSQRLHEQCQAFLLSQLPEEVRPAALAAAGHLGDIDFDNAPSDQLGTIPAEPHEEGGDDVMHDDTNAPCTIAELGEGVALAPCSACLEGICQDKDPALFVDHMLTSMCPCAENTTAAGSHAQPAGSWGIPPFFVERGSHTDAHPGPAFDFRCGPASSPVVGSCSSLQVLVVQRPNGCSESRTTVTELRQ